MYNDENESESGYSWINWFCDLEGHEFFCEVDEEYILDNFNLYGLRAKVQNYSEALQMILSAEAPDSEDLNDPNYLEIYQSAMDLYGLIHARFLISQRGLTIMRHKFLIGNFGTCPRVLCKNQNVLPIGVSEELSTSRVKVYCPKCEDVYFPNKKCIDIDGAYFGTSFPHILLQTFQELVPNLGPPACIPRIYGFRIYGKRGSKYEKKSVEECKGVPVEERSEKTETHPNRPEVMGGQGAISGGVVPPVIETPPNPTIGLPANPPKKH